MPTTTPAIYKVTDLDTKRVKVFHDNGAALGYIMALLDAGHSYTLEIEEGGK